jgi:hypothetical protein
MVDRQQSSTHTSGHGDTHGLAVARGENNAVGELSF